MKALGFNSLKVHPFQSVSFNCQPAPLRLVHIDVTKDSSTMKTPWGLLTPPLGLRRLKVVDILATLVRAKSDRVAEVVIRLGKAVQVDIRLTPR